MKNVDELYMELALKEASKAKEKDEVPVGCVIVLDDKVIAKAHNLKECKHNALAHAEIIAINKASKKLGVWRLENATMYVTLEPCPMCAGAIYQSRIKKIVYGAKDIKQGAVDSIINLYDIKTINHHPEVVGGVLENECSTIIKDFFKNKRK